MKPHEKQKNRKTMWMDAVECVDRDMKMMGLERKMADGSSKMMVENHRCQLW